MDDPLGASTNPHATNNSTNTNATSTNTNTNTAVTTSVQLPPADLASSAPSHPTTSSAVPSFAPNGTTPSTSAIPLAPNNDLERNASLRTTTTSNTSRTNTSSANAHPDPYQLRDRVLTEEQLAGLRNRFKHSGPLSKFGFGLGMGIVGSSGTRRGRALEEYHVRQNNLIPELLKPIAEHTASHEADADAARLPVKIAVYSSLYANVALCVVQVYAAVSSLSLSLISTGIDSVFDIGSNGLLFYLHRKAAKMRADENKWPVGGARLECIGNIIFGFLMCAVNLVVIVESVRAIITKEGDELHKFHLPSILAVSASLAVKLALFLYSYGLRNKSSQVQMLWEDHRNDLFLNGFAIITATGGSKIVWWLDPAGAIVLGAVIIISWSRTIHAEFTQLAGKSAPHEFMQLLTYKAATFSDAIERVDTVRAYHSGPNYFVEVDIVMDGASTLYAAHDLSQSLQDSLETLPGVERAFVHVDYETDHTPEHRKRKLA